MRAYYRMLTGMDNVIGRVRKSLSERGLAENTVIIYTADNGSIPTDDPGNINGPVRGHKASVWEGGIRVPFMVTGPGVKAGSVCRTPVVGYDILPTVCSLAGINTWPKGVEGGSIHAIITGDGSGKVKRPRSTLVFHWPHYQHEKHSTPDTTLLADGWKLHYWWEAGNVQLFNLDADLAETKDLAAAQPERAEAMKKSLMDYLKGIGAPERPDRVTLLAAPQAFFGLMWGGWVLRGVVILLAAAAVWTVIQRVRHVARAT